MIRASRSATAAALLALAGAPAAAQVPLEVQLSPMVGLTRYLSDPPARFILADATGRDRVIRGGSFAATYTVGGSVGVRVADLGVAEGMLFWAPARLRADDGLPGGEVEVDSYMYGANFLFLLPGIGRSEPFVTLGLGQERTRYALEEAVTHTDFLWSFGPGVTLAVAERTGVRIDLKDCVSRFGSHTADGEDRYVSHLMLLVGVSYRRPLVRR